MGKNTEKAAEPEVVTEKTETVEQTAEVVSESTPIENDDAAFRAAVEPQISALVEKIFELRPDGAIGGDKGAIGVAIDLLDEYEGKLSNIPQSDGFNDDLANIELRIADINKGLYPLAHYLRDEGLITNDPSVEITILELCETAANLMKSSRAKIVELVAKIEELTPDPSDNPKGKAKSISMPKSVDADDYSTASNVVFADERGKVITDLPILSFSSEKFLNNATGRTLQEPIEFPVHIPACAVAAVYLVDPKGKAVGVSEMVMPLHVGGGKSARITAGSLLFRAPS